MKPEGTLERQSFLSPFKWQCCKGTAPSELETLLPFPKLTPKDWSLGSCFWYRSGVSQATASHTSTGVHPNMNPTEIVSPQPCSEQGHTGLHCNVHRRLGYWTAMPGPAQESRGHVGSTVGSALGREQLMEAGCDKPWGKVAAKQHPYDKNGEHVPPGPAGRHPLSQLGSPSLKASVLVLSLPLRRQQNRAILLFFRLFIQTICFLSPRCMAPLQATNTRSVMPCSASESI